MKKNNETNLIHILIFGFLGGMIIGLLIATVLSYTDIRVTPALGCLIGLASGLAMSLTPMILLGRRS